MQQRVELFEDKLNKLNDKISLSEKVRFIHSFLKDSLGFVDRLAVVVYDSKSDLLKTFIYSSNEDHPLVQYQARLIDAPSLQLIVQNRRSRVVNDLDIFYNGKHEHTRWIAEQGFGSSYTHPIYHNGLFLGFVFFNSYQKHFFRQRALLYELDIFSHLISLMIINELSTIRVMVATVHAARHITAHRGRESGSHIDRVSHYARLIAQELASKYGFNDEFIEHIFLFSPLHDIGKIGLPDAVLKKTEKLTPGERERMGEHVVLGRQIIDAIIKDFGTDTFQHVTMLRNIAEYHHETVDGSGYARGLKGKEIPIEARIISVADFFDALTSRRPYKVAWTNEEAFAILQRLMGFKLDRDCVEALLQNRDRVKEIQERFKEDFGEK